MKFFFPFFLHEGPWLNRRSRDLPSFLRSFFSDGANFSFTARSLYLRSSFAPHCAFFAHRPRAKGATSDWGGIHRPCRAARVSVCVCESVKKWAFLTWRAMSGRTATKRLVSKRKRTRRLNAHTFGEVARHTTRSSLSSCRVLRLIKTPDEFWRGQTGQESWVKTTQLFNGNVCVTMFVTIKMTACPFVPVLQRPHVVSSFLISWHEEKFRILPLCT